MFGWVWRDARGAKGPALAARHGARCCLAVALLACCCAGVARADCESGIAALTSAVAAARDAHQRAQLQNDLQRAQFELWEFDEVECAMVLDHAARVLQKGHDKVAAGSPPRTGN